MFPVCGDAAVPMFFEEFKLGSIDARLAFRCTLHYGIPLS